MKNIRLFQNLIFWLTLFLPGIAFWAACKVGEVDIFSIAGTVRYSWIMWLFIPVGVLSIITGLKLKKDNQRYKKFIVVACICLPLLFIFGSYRFVFADTISYDANNIEIVEAKTGIDLPNYTKVATIDLNYQNITYAKILDESDKDNFEQSIYSNPAWQRGLRTNIKALLPVDIQMESAIFDYFVFYNANTSQYNIYPPVGQYDCVLIAYDFDLGRLLILDNLLVQVN